MKNIAVTIFIGVVIAVLILFLFSFQVRETESALVMTFGKASAESTITKPGWYFKWPPPVQTVKKIDSRMQIAETELAETATKGQDPIIISTFVVWEVADPLGFYNANGSGSLKNAQKNLLSQLRHVQSEVIGQFGFSELVNSNPQKIKINEIEKQMLAAVQPPMLNDFGISIKTLGIKQLKIDKDVTKQVFATMASDRKGRADKIITEGQAEAMKIKSDADSKKTILLAAAKARAEAIRGEGDAKAAQYYKKLEQDPELAMFLRDLEALKEILKDRSTLLLTAETEPFKLLKQMPKMEPKTENNTIGSNK